MLANDISEQNKLCKGCLSVSDETYASCYLANVYNGNFVSNVFKYGDLSIIENCPCISCVVKPICSRFCNNYQEYALQW